MAVSDDGTETEYATNILDQYTSVGGGRLRATMSTAT